MPFKDFLGNPSVVRTLQRQLMGDRLPHTLLFAGLAGVGKKTLALGLAKALNCLRTEFDFCNHCPSCRKIEEAFHPDVRIYAPEGQFIKIDQMREFSREAFYRPFEGRRRVFIIEQAEKLTTEAANSILKTIEEPPETSTIVLITEKSNDLLLTIRSRAHLYQLTPLSPEVLERWLAERKDYPRQDLALLSGISGGALGKALQIDVEEYRRTRQEMMGLLESCAVDFAYHRVADIVEKITSKKESEKVQFEFRLEVLCGLLHDLFHLGVDETSKIRNDDIKERLLGLSRRLSFPQVVSATQVLDQIQLGAKRNLNKGLMVDRVVFRLGGSLRDE